MNLIQNCHGFWRGNIVSPPYLWMRNPQIWRADYATWASTDSNIYNGSWNQTPVNTEEWLHMLLYRKKKKKNSQALVGNSTINTRIKSWVLVVDKSMNVMICSQQGYSWGILSSWRLYLRHSFYKHNSASNNFFLISAN